MYVVNASLVAHVINPLSRGDDETTLWGPTAKCKIAPMDSSLVRYDEKLVYVANLRVPSEKAHVLQSFKMCEGYCQVGPLTDRMSQ